MSTAFHAAGRIEWDTVNRMVSPDAHHRSCQRPISATSYHVTKPHPQSDKMSPPRATTQTAGRVSRRH
jgi:hypothetical protein